MFSPLWLVFLVIIIALWLACASILQPIMASFSGEYIFLPDYFCFIAIFILFFFCFCLQTLWARATLTNWLNKHKWLHYLTKEHIPHFAVVGFWFCGLTHLHQTKDIVSSETTKTLLTSSAGQSCVRVVKSSANFRSVFFFRAKVEISTFFQTGSLKGSWFVLFVIMFLIFFICFICLSKIVWFNQIFTHLGV